MSFDEPGSPPPDTLEPAHYVAFLEHWAAEFPTVPRSRPLPAEPEAERDEHPLTAGPQAGAEPPGATPPPVPDWAPKSGATGEPGPLRLPRRREATETLRVRLTPEHLYWLRLTAARAGAKIDESLLVAAGLMLLAERPIDWRAMRSRRVLRAALASSPPPPPPSRAADAPGEP